MIMYTWEFASLYMHRGQKKPLVLLHSFETGFLIGRSRLAGQQAPGTLLYLPPQIQGHKHVSTTPSIFTWVLETELSCW